MNPSKLLRKLEKLCNSIMVRMHVCSHIPQGYGIVEATFELTTGKNARRLPITQKSNQSMRRTGG